MSLFNIFGSNQQQAAAANPAPAPQPVINSSVAHQQTGPTPQNPQDTSAFNSNTTQQPNNQANPTSPLDQFADLWKTNENAENRVADATENLFELDSTKLGETVSKMNFGDQAVINDLMAKAQAGDNTAMVQMMQIIARDAYYKSAILQSHIANNVYNSSVSKVAEYVPQHVKSNLVHNQLVNTNTNFAHPAVQETIRATAARIQQANPAMTPEQVAAQTKAYMESLASAFSPQQTPTTQHPTTLQAGGSNFDKFFGANNIFS